MGLIPRSRKSPRENSNPFYHSCLENRMDREAWWDTAHGIHISSSFSRSAGEDKQLFYRLPYQLRWQRIHLQCKRPGSIPGSGRSAEEGRDRLPSPVFLGFPCGLAGKELACNAGDLGLIPGLGRSPGEGKSYPLRYPLQLFLLTFLCFVINACYKCHHLLQYGGVTFFLKYRRTYGIPGLQPSHTKSSKANIYRKLPNSVVKSHSGVGLCYDFRWTTIFLLVFQIPYDDFPVG